MPRLDRDDLAPAFTLPDSTGEPVSLCDYAGKPVILFFYPAAMTPGCTTQAQDFRDGLDRFADAGYAVLGISPDSVAKLARFVEQEHLTYPLVSDADRSVLQAYGAYGEKTMYGKTTLGVIRSTVVVGGTGRVELAKYNVRAKGHVAALALALGVELE